MRTRRSLSHSSVLGKNIYASSEELYTRPWSRAVSNMAARKVLRLIVVLHVFSHCVNMFRMNKDEYLRLRNSMIHKEYQMRIGGKMELSDEELRVNATLMKFKASELDAARRNITKFPPAVHFFRAKALIDKSDVFKIIRTMPKGKLITYTCCPPSCNVTYQLFMV